MVKEYFAAVTWDGRRAAPVIIFSDMGGIDIEEVAEKHPEHVSRTHVSNLLPFQPYQAKEAVAATGVSGEDLGKLAAIVQMLVEVFQRYDLTLAEINPIGKTADGRILVLDGHVDLEGDARDKHAKVIADLGIGKDETREARPPTAFEIKGAQVDAADHRGVAGNVREFDGDLLIIGAGGSSPLRRHPQPRGKPANYADRRQPEHEEDEGADQAHPLETASGSSRDDERGLEYPRRHRRVIKRLH